MCLAIPGQIVEIVDAENFIAKVEVSGVRRNISIGLLNADEAKVGNWVLIHVGFALNCINEEEAQRAFELLRAMGPSLEEELAMMEQSERLNPFET